MLTLTQLEAIRPALDAWNAAIKRAQFAHECNLASEPRGVGICDRRGIDSGALRRGKCGACANYYRRTGRTVQWEA